MERLKSHKQSWSQNVSMCRCRVNICADGWTRRITNVVDLLCGKDKRFNQNNSNNLFSLWRTCDTSTDHSWWCRTSVCVCVWVTSHPALRVHMTLRCSGVCFERHTCRFLNHHLWRCWWEDYWRSEENISLTWEKHTKHRSNTHHSFSQKYRTLWRAELPLICEHLIGWGVVIKSNQPIRQAVIMFR